MLVTLLYIELFIFLGFFVFHQATKKYINPYKTVLYYGKKGCGKTTLLTKIAIKKIKKGIPVYSNVEIPGTRLFNPKDLKSFTPEPNSVVLIDEIGLIWDNRNFKSFESDINAWFKYARQYRVEVHMFSQVPDIDLKIRNLCDSYFLIENKFRVFSYGKRISKVLTVKTDIEGKGNLVDSFEFAPLIGWNTRKLTYIPRWSEFYLSFDPPKREYMPYSQLPMSAAQIESMNNHKKFMIIKKCKSLSMNSKKKFDKISTDFFIKISSAANKLYKKNYE